MGKALLVLSSQAIRERAIDWVRRAPDHTRLTFNGPKRTIAQNDKFHALVTDIVRQKRYHGMKLDLDDYKLVFMDALNRETRIVPNLDGTGFVNLGRSTSKLCVADFSDLIELVLAWGAQNDVVFSDPQYAREEEMA